MPPPVGRGSVQLRPAVIAGPEKPEAQALLFRTEGSPKLNAGASSQVVSAAGAPQGVLASIPQQQRLERRRSTKARLQRERRSRVKAQARTFCC